MEEALGLQPWVFFPNAYPKKALRFNLSHTGTTRTRNSARNLSHYFA
jgi:hypothetical protein